MLRQLTVITFLGLIIGSVSALVAIGFVDAVIWLNDILLISPRSRVLVSDGTLLTVITIAVPTLGGLFVGYVSQFIPERRPHGPPDVIQAAQGHGSMPVKAGALTAVSACVSLGSGASVGQYGPLAHMGASLGFWISRFAGTSRYLGTVGIGCGVAAAIATAFNAPIAGLVFAHEVILRHYSLRAFAPITVAATLGYIVSNTVFERPPLFRIESVHIVNTYEFIVFIGIGMVGAVIAMLFMRMLLQFNLLSKSLKLPPAIKTAIAGLAVGLVALQLPDVLGIGKELLRFAVIEDAFTAGELTTLILAKIFLTALCIGFGFAGGVFSPALVIGILFGALVALGMDSVLIDGRSHISIYAVCGMVAVTGPVIGAPLTTILIVFELTGNYDLATAAMVSVAFANLLGYRIFDRSLFDAQLKNRGFDLSLGRDKVIMEQRSIREFVSDNYTALPDSASLEQVRNRLLDDQTNEAYILTSSGKYSGTISMNQLMALVSNNQSLSQEARDFAIPEKLILSPDTSIWQSMVMLRNFVGESIPVTEEGKFLGVVFEASIVDAYLTTLNEIRQDENAAA